jgi:drug/metabolite transporter (DMT)-like permease
VYPLVRRRMESRLTTYLMLVGAATGWGLSATTVKFSVDDLAPLTAACLRFGLGGLLLLAILWRRGQVRKLPRPRDWPFVIALGVLGVTAFGALYTTGMQWTGAGEGTLIQGTSPLVTMLLAAALLGERLGPAQLAGVAVCFGGLVLLVLGGPDAWGGGSLRLIGDALMVGSAVSWGSYSVAVRLVMGRFSLAETSAYSVIAGSLLLLPLALLETPRMPLGEVRAATWLAVGYQFAVSTSLAYLWWNEGVRRIGAGRAAVFSYIGPVVAVISAALVLGERLGPLQLVGGATVLAGLVLANRRR